MADMIWQVPQVILSECPAKLSECKILSDKNSNYCINPIQGEGGGAKTPVLHFFIKLLKEGSNKWLL